jgi:TrmH family RNA methyltransferase
LKWYKGLANLRQRLEAGAFLAEGERAISQIISNFPDHVIEILATEDHQHRYSDYPFRKLTESQLKSVSSSRTPQGVIALIRLPDNAYSDRLPPDPGEKILFLDDIQDPGNTGTLIRTAAAFDFSGILLTDKCADPFSPKCVQSSAGTMLSLWLRRTADYLKIIDTLRNTGYKLIATDLKGKDSPEIIKNQNKFMLALGNEAAGLGVNILKRADFRIRIPVNREKAESLNVAASGAIFMYLGSI